MSTDYGAEQNAWLVDLSFLAAGILGVLFAALLAFLFWMPLLRLVAVPLRPLSFVLTGAKLLVKVTPLRIPLRRYLYVGRHLQEA